MYNIEVINNQIILTTIEDNITFIHTIKKDKYNDLIVTFQNNSEKITRYNTINEILEDRNYFIQTLEENKGEYSNIYEDLFYGNHYKGQRNFKIDIETDSINYQTTFKTFLGNITFQNDTCEEIGYQVNLLIDDEYIGTLNDKEYWILGNINTQKIKRTIENYLNNLPSKTYTKDNVKIELIIMLFHLFPNHIIED